MLHGFGLAPVCLEFDLDSYDGPSTHVERFRGRSGWLVVAEAHISSAEAHWLTSVVAACDEYGEPVPAFMAPNLIACACSHPSPCDEIPPDELDDLLEDAAHELKLKWLRESNTALARLAESAAVRIATMEGQTKVLVEDIDRRIADLHRRRRMANVPDAARAVFQDAIIGFEMEREVMTERLAAGQRQLRRAVEEEECLLLGRANVGVVLEPLYRVRWSAAPRYNQAIRLSRLQALRRSDFHPRSLRGGGNLWISVDIARDTAAAAEEWRALAHTLDVEWQAALAKGLVVKNSLEEVATAPSLQYVPINLVEFERLRKRAAAFARQAAAERQIGMMASRRYRIKLAALRRDAQVLAVGAANEDAADRRAPMILEDAARDLVAVEEILARHDASASAPSLPPPAQVPASMAELAVPVAAATLPPIASPVATAPLVGDGKRRLERAALATQLLALETAGRKFLNGSPKFARNREQRAELADRISALDEQINATDAIEFAE
jgi:hypothetical protein